MGARQKLSLVLEGIDDFRYGSTKIVRSGRGHNSSFLDRPLVAAASFEHANYCADPIPDENVEKPATHFADGRTKSRNSQNVGRLSHPETAGSAQANFFQTYGVLYLSPERGTLAVKHDRKSSKIVQNGEPFA